MVYLQKKFKVWLNSARVKDTKIICLFCLYRNTKKYNEIPVINYRISHIHWRVYLLQCTLFKCFRGVHCPAIKTFWYVDSELKVIFTLSFIWLLRLYIFPWDTYVLCWYTAEYHVRESLSCEITQLASNPIRL